MAFVTGAICSLEASIASTFHAAGVNVVVTLFDDASGANRPDTEMLVK